jgi:hypothetical protein
MVRAVVMIQRAFLRRRNKAMSELKARFRLNIDDVYRGVYRSIDLGILHLSISCSFRINPITHVKVADSIGVKLFSHQAKMTVLSIN